MYGGQGKIIAGERFVSGALSAMLSAGMLVALVGLSVPGSHPRHERPSLSTFELAAPEGQRADEAPKAPPAEPPPPPKPMAVAEPPRTPPLQEPAKTLPDTPQPMAAAKQVQVAVADNHPSARAPEAPAAPAPAEAAPAKAAEAKASPAAETAQGATYKGKIWRHLQRFRRSNVVGPGSAFVGFSLEDRGKVTELAIVKTSGSSRFDGEALQMVRRAEPFPAPPPHVARAFIFEIKGN